MLRVRATDISGREEMLTPTFLRLRRGIDSPAEGAVGRFPVDRRPAELLRLRVWRGEELLFDGKPDEQRFTLSAAGMLLQIEARTKGGILLDNEARPETFEHPTVAGVFGRLIGPHGFLLIGPHATLPAFTVRKGLTLWDAFSAFTRRTLGRLPYVVGDMVFTQPPVQGEPMAIGGRALPFSRLEHSLCHYRPVSRVYIRDDEGYYQTWVGNPDAAARQILRERYLIPAGEFANIPRWDSHARIRRSMREMEKTTVELPGCHTPRLGQGVIVENGQVFLPNLVVDQVEYTLDERGERTTLVLASAMYG